ncbi:MAG: PAS domain S-box protein [Pseudomonadota bacterium]
MPTEPRDLPLVLDREALLRSIVATAPDAIVTIDDRGTVLSFSPAGETMFGYHHDEIEQRSVNLLMPDSHAAAHDGYIKHYLDTGEARIIGKPRVLSARRKSGAIFPIRLTVGEAQHANGRFFVGFIEDLTRQEETRQRLEAVQAELERTARLSTMGEMTAALAHEINQPLTGAISATEAADLILERDGIGEGHKVRRQLAQGLGDMQRVAEIVRHIRRFLQTGAPDLRPTSLNDIVREASLLAIMGANPEIALTLHLDRGLQPVAIDRVQVQQIVVNLVRNAVDAVAEADEKAITVSTERSDTHVYITVADTGKGIPADIADHIFEPLVTSKPNGLGLGLAIARRLIRAHGGTLTAGETAGGGVVFKVHLPIQGLAAS